MLKRDSKKKNEMKRITEIAQQREVIVKLFIAKLFKQNITVRDGGI